MRLADGGGYGGSGGYCAWCRGGPAGLLAKVILTARKWVGQSDERGGRGVKIYASFYIILHYYKHENHIVFRSKWN